MTPRQTGSQCPLYKAYLCILLDPLSDPIKNRGLYALSDGKTGLQGEIG